MDEQPIDYKQAGFLRRMPPRGAVPVPHGAATRYGWPALAQLGLAESTPEGYRRSLAGERALACYDAALSVDDLAVLAWVREYPHRMRGIWSVHRFVGAGLVAIGARSNGTPRLTEAGEALMVARGALGRRAA